jgi:hypothetical protein
MSYLGCIGDIMSGSGIFELLSTIYAENTVTHMLSGKAYAGAMRGHTILQEAIFFEMLEQEKSLSIHLNVGSLNKAAIIESFSDENLVALGNNLS